MADFAGKLSHLMEAAAMSQSELSRRSGVPQTTISGYLRRDTKASWSHVQSLARALGVSVEALTDDPPEPPPAPPPEPAPPKRSKRK